jgi:PPOX class probable F420-dependent enzyme
MTDAEVAAFLAEQRVLTCATTGTNGRPHLAPLWYVPVLPHLLSWTYASAQKAVNLRRSPQATVQVEAGAEYSELRGVTIECDVELVSDPAAVRDIGVAIAQRYGGAAGPSGAFSGTTGEASPELIDMIARQAAKRVGLRFTPTRTASWDHRKLAGAY